MEPSDRPSHPAVNDPAIEAELARQSCVECGKVLAPEEGTTLRNGQRFCQNCYADLRHSLEHAAQYQRRDIPYTAAALFALVAGAIGLWLWWQVTVRLHVPLGFVSLAIPLLVGYAIRFAAGGRRSPGLQAIAVVTTFVMFLAGLFLMNRELIRHSMDSGGGQFRVPLLGSPQYLWRVLSVRAGADPTAYLDILFAVICVYLAWKFTRPLRIRS